MILPGAIAIQETLNEIVGDLMKNTPALPYPAPKRSIKFVASFLFAIFFSSCGLSGIYAIPDYEIVTTHSEFQVDGFKVVFDLPEIGNNETLSKTVDQTMAHFRSDQLRLIEEFCADGCQGEEIYSFDIVHSDDHFLSIYIFDYSDTFGAAHPSHQIFSFTWWVPEGRLLSLKDLFLPEAPYLQELSRLSRMKLHSDKEFADATTPEWIDEGTEPTPYNFRVWTVSNDGISIIFNEYQVASYADGPQRVDIAFSELKTIIDPKGPLFHLNR